MHPGASSEPFGVRIRCRSFGGRAGAAGAAPLAERTLVALVPLPGAGREWSGAEAGRGRPGVVLVPVRDAVLLWVRAHQAAKDSADNTHAGGRQ